MNWGVFLKIELSNKKILGLAVRVLRLYFEESLTALAEALDVKTSYLSEIERGDKKVNEKMLKSIYVHYVYCHDIVLERVFKNEGNS